MAETNDFNLDSLKDLYCKYLKGEVRYKKSIFFAVIFFLLAILSFVLNINSFYEDIRKILLFFYEDDSIFAVILLIVLAILIAIYAIFKEKLSLSQSIFLPLSSILFFLPVIVASTYLGLIGLSLMIFILISIFFFILGIDIEPEEKLLFIIKIFGEITQFILVIFIKLANYIAFILIYIIDFIHQNWIYLTITFSILSFFNLYKMFKYENNYKELIYKKIITPLTKVYGCNITKTGLDKKVVKDCEIIEYTDKVNIYKESCSCIVKEYYIVSTRNKISSINNDFEFSFVKVEFKTDVYDCNTDKDCTPPDKEERITFEGILYHLELNKELTKLDIEFIIKNVFFENINKENLIKVDYPKFNEFLALEVYYKNQAGSKTDLIIEAKRIFNPYIAEKILDIFYIFKFSKLRIYKKDLYMTINEREILFPYEYHDEGLKIYKEHLDLLIYLMNFKYYLLEILHQKQPNNYRFFVNENSKLVDFARF